MTPPLPTCVKIGPYDYDIQWIDKKEADRRACHGIHYGDDQDLVLSHEDKRQRIFNTALHEIIHGILGVVPLSDTVQEEVMVKSLANGISMVWRDNRELFRWLDGLLDDPTGYLEGKGE